MALKKVLFVTTVEATHRAFLLPYAKRFRELGWIVDGAARGISGVPECKQAYSQVFDLKWSRNPTNIRDLLASSRDLRSFVASESYDIVHVHTPIAAFVTRFALRRLRRRGRPRLIYTAHGFHFHPLGDSVSNAAFLALEKAAGRWTDRLIVINELDYLTAIEHRIVPRDSIVQMPSIGIDRSEFSPNAIRLDEVNGVRAELGLSDGTSLFLVLAEFMPGKRHIDALEAFRDLKRNAHLAFAGSGRDFDRIKKSVHQMGLDGRVHFLGLRNDVRTLIKSSVATIVPSIREGFSRCVLESLCMEVPVIGTDIRGVADLLKKGGGLIVPVRSPKAIREAMEWVLDNPEESQAMGRTGRGSTSEYDIANLLRLHEILYQEMISG